MERPYKVICISTYPEDLAVLDAKVAAPSRAGWPKASRSSVLRAAVAALDVAKYAGERATEVL